MNPGDVFNFNELREGDIIHVRRPGSFIGRMIRRAVKSWGNHDALAVMFCGHWYVGDAVHPQAQLTPLKELAGELAAGGLEVRVYRPWNGTRDQGEAAAAWWIKNACGAWYDWGAYPRLLLKALVGDWLPWAAGWKWAWYCTESVRLAWVQATQCEALPRGVDFWRNNNPTPRTTEKRVEDELLVDVTARVAWPAWLQRSEDGFLAIGAPMDAGQWAGRNDAGQAPSGAAAVQPAGCGSSRLRATRC